MALDIFIGMLCLTENEKMTLIGLPKWSIGLRTARWAENGVKIVSAQASASVRYSIAALIGP